MEWSAYMQRDFELQFEQIKIEEKRPTFDPYPDGYAGYATSSEHLIDEPIPSTSQEANRPKIATSSESTLKSPKHKKQKTEEIHYEIEEEEEVCKDKIYRYHNLRTPKEQLEHPPTSSFSIEPEAPKYQMKKLGKGKKYITGAKELRKVTVSRLRSREIEIKITTEENKHIERNRELLHGKNIIAIDIEKIRLNVKPTTTPDAAF